MTSSAPMLPPWSGARNRSAGARYEQLANEMIKLTVENLRFFGTVSAPPLVAMVNDRVGNMRGGEGWVNGLRRLHPYLTETWYLKQ